MKNFKLLLLSSMCLSLASTQHSFASDTEDKDLKQTILSNSQSSDKDNKGKDELFDSANSEYDNDDNPILRDDSEGDTPLLLLPREILYMVLNLVPHPKDRSNMAQTCRQLRDLTYVKLVYEDIPYLLPPKFMIFLDACIGKGGDQAMRSRKCNRLVLDFELNTPEGRGQFIDTYGDPIRSMICSETLCHNNERVNALAHEVFPRAVGANTSCLKNFMLAQPIDSTELTISEHTVALKTLQDGLYCIREIERFSQLHTLRYSMECRALSPKFCNLSHLRVLKITNHRMGGPSALHQLPTHFGKLTALEELQLPYNNLTRLPASFTELSRLRVLELQNNRFTDFPLQVLNLTGLEVLDLSSLDQISGHISVGEGVGEGTTIPRLTFMNRIPALPEEICMLKGIKRLYVGGNPISVLPGSVSQLENLEVLNAAWAQLNGIQDEICHLPKLERLEVAGNPISDIPEGVTLLTNLEVLNLNFTQVRLVPAALKNKPGLQVQTFNYNRKTSEG